jgi:short subunit dehydrogenase-like uncharacterized protein
MKAFDLVVFGASGFTGQYVVREILQVVKDSRFSNLRWAVAGRNKKKVEETMRAVTSDTGENYAKHRLLMRQWVALWNPRSHCQLPTPTSET